MVVMEEKGNKKHKTYKKGKVLVLNLISVITLNTNETLQIKAETDRNF